MTTEDRVCGHEYRSECNATVGILKVNGRGLCDKPTGM